MTRYQITLVRNDHGFFLNNSLGADGFNAISSIPGTEDVQIESESDSHVEISYVWTATEKFWTTQEHLAKFNLCRKER